MSRFQWLEFENPSSPGEMGDRQPGADKSGLGENDPSDPQYILRLADEAYRKMDWEKALKLYSRTLGIDNTIEAAWIGQLRCLLDLQEIPEALTWAVKTQKMFAKSPDVQAARALALARSGNLQEALAFSDASIKSEHVGWYPWVVRGEILAHTGSASADFCMNKAREVAPNDWLVQLKIAEGYKNAGLFEKAIPIFKKVLGLQSDLAEAWYELGECYQNIGLFSEAGNAFAKAAKLVPHNKKYSEAQARVLNVDPIQSIIGWLRGIWKGVFGR